VVSIAAAANAVNVCCIGPCVLQNCRTCSTGYTEHRKIGKITSQVASQPGKDFGSHTKQFNQVYINDYCSIAGSGAGMDSDQHAMFECYYDASPGVTNSSGSSSSSQH
jgi:hypothetical protein